MSAGSRLAALGLLFGPSMAAQTGLHLAPYRTSLLYSNTFTRTQKIAWEEDLIAPAPGGEWHRIAKPPPEAEWIVEGTGEVEIRRGKLHVAPFPLRRSHMVIWNRNVFPANFLLEFEMSPGASLSGLTIVFFCAAGLGGNDMFDLSMPPRRADYAAYHSGAIANYSDSYWSRNNETESATNRMRRNPGFQLVAEAPSMTAGKAGATCRVRILKYGGHIEVEVNGKLLFQWDDRGTPLGPGRIGFRSMDGVAGIDYSGLRVWELTPGK